MAECRCLSGGFLGVASVSGLPPTVSSSKRQSSSRGWSNHALPRALRLVRRSDGEEAAAGSSRGVVFMGWPPVSSPSDQFLRRRGVRARSDRGRAQLAHAGKHEVAGSIRMAAPVPQKVTASELDSILSAERTSPMIIDFYATWCGPCVVLAQELEQLAVEYGEDIRFLKVDTDEEHELASQMEIRGLPTMVFVSKDVDKLAIRTEGLLPRNAIREIIEKELLV